MKILIVEDEPKTGDYLRQGMVEAGFVADLARTGPDGLHLALEEKYDLAILDVMLPGLDGRELLARLRKAGHDLPVLFLTARDSVEDRVAGLELGADDYLVKPFAFAELLARVQALVRRASGTAEPTRLAFDDISLDLLTRRVLRGETALDLRPREFSLLEYFLRHRGRVLSKTMILSHVWGYQFDPGTNVVDVLVSRLREKVDRPFERKLIHTVRGVGYVLRVG